MPRRVRLIPAAALPWRRPSHELLLLALVAAATLLPLQPPDTQDRSRMCLTLALERGHVSADSCLAGNIDYSSFAGHLYSDKAPGVSILAVPAAEVVRLPQPGWRGHNLKKLWLVRLSTGGTALLLCCFLLGRLAEGLSPGWGGATLVTAAAGTLMSSLAAESFDEVQAAALGFAAFLLAWKARPAWAGLVAGIAVLVEYQASLTLCAVGLYLALRGWRSLGRYVAGVLPGLAILALYDWAAFGSPLHLSYRYVAARFAEQQASGFFGIHAPTWRAIDLVLFANRGLLVDAPVLALAPLGLWALWRRGLRAEALLCAIVTGAFLALEFGYYDPYGGASPGPRFLIPALPFLAVGLAPAFAARPRLTSALAAASVVASTAILVTWPAATTGLGSPYRWSVWRAFLSLARSGSSSDLAVWTQKTAFTWIGIGRLGGAALLLVCALTALAVSLRDGWSRRVERG
jgi:hypothetical protein